MSDTEVSQPSCSACGKPVMAYVRRCPACGAWLRPWSTGGKPSTWSRYRLGGAGRPEEWGAELGDPSEAAGSVWSAYGPNMDRVRQATASGEPAPSGAHALKRRAERAVKERRRRAKPSPAD